MPADRTRGLAWLRPAWPQQCVLCRSWARQPLCPDCLANTADARPRCGRCALPLMTATTPCGHCLREPPPFEHGVAAGDYGFPWDRMIAAFKFEGRVELAGALAQALTAAIAAASTPEVDLVAPVPLSRARLAERGYNQAWELARRVARRRGLPACADALLRLRDTAHQVGLDRRQRDANLHRAFIAEPDHVARLRGRRIALVDDVMTTGVTLAAASRALLEAGAAAVQVWVVARTPEPQQA